MTAITPDAGPLIARTNTRHGWRCWWRLNLTTVTSTLQCTALIEVRRRDAAMVTRNGYRHWAGRFPRTFPSRLPPLKNHILLTLFLTIIMALTINYYYFCYYYKRWRLKWHCHAQTLQGHLTNTKTVTCWQWRCSGISILAKWLLL